MSVPRPCEPRAGEEPALRRRLSLTLLVLYGLGTTIGAGIFALIGKVTGAAGLYTPLAFVLAALLAGLSALAFAELSARFPSSAGEARYVREGFRSGPLALAVGLMVVLAGTVSAAAVTHGFAGYLESFVALPRAAVIAATVLALALIAAWGIGESVLLAGLLTLLEAGGLLVVIGAGLEAPPLRPITLDTVVPGLEAGLWAGVLAGAFLAFYAFIGFEDMVNVAEEVHDVTRTLPRAIVLTLLVTLLLYVALAVVAVRAVPIAELAASPAPLALVYERATGGSAALIGGIALIATVNGALIQIIMASRVLYGLARQALLPQLLGRVAVRTRTPLVATAMVGALVLLFALALPITPLAQATSALTLLIFALVNLALWRVKRRAPRPPGLRVLPAWVPLAGFLASAGFLAAAALSLLGGPALR